MSKQTWKGSALLAPLPAVLVTSRSGGKDNVFTVAWAGITNTQPPKCSISIRPERLSYVDEVADAEQIRELSMKLEIGQAVPEILVAAKDGEFYVKSGLPSALAYAFNMNSLIPAVLVPYEADGKIYVKMKNSF